MRGHGQEGTVLVPGTVVLCLTRTHGLEAPRFLLLLVLGPHHGLSVQLSIGTIVLLGGGREGGQWGLRDLGTVGDMAVVMGVTAALHC